MIKYVKVDKIDNCLTYALKRIDKFHLFPIDYETLSNGFMANVYTFDNNKLEKCDLLVYNYNYENKWIENEITENMIIITNSVGYGLHYLVYEGHGYVSDLAASEEYRYIRLRKLENILKKPDLIVRFKEN